MQPIIAITIYRRYAELQKNIQVIWDRMGEFDLKPIVIVLWVNPEVSRLWFFNELLETGKIDELITRGTPNDGSISYEESRNIRQLLEHVDSKYKDYFVILQCADISVKPGTYRYVQKAFQEGNHGVLFHMQNSIMHSGIWHTNFFALNDKSLWPPIAERNDCDILERKWGRHLADEKIGGYLASHNNSSKKFIHDHESERLPEFPHKPQRKLAGVNLFMGGRYTLSYRLKQFLGWVRKWLRS